MTSGYLRFAVLGPFTITHGPASVVLPAAKHRALLGVLLARANSVVSVDQLLDELWDSQPPRSARKTLQGYVWRIRRALPLADDQLITVGPGYRLAVATAALDTLEFEHLLMRARSYLSAGCRQLGVDTLADALRLWRGNAFDGVPQSILLQAHASRLNETMLSTYELFVSTQLELGHGSEMIPQLNEAASRQPYRESLHRLLMAALYRDGRPLDALEVYNRFRYRVTTVFGLDPHQDTVRLHQSILRGLPIGRAS